MFELPEFPIMLFKALIPSMIYAVVLWFFIPGRPKSLPMTLLFAGGAILIAPCYAAEYILDAIFPWGSSGYLPFNTLPSAILEEAARLLGLFLAFNVFLGKPASWQYHLISGFMLGSGFMFMENFVCMAEYWDIYMWHDNFYAVELTEPLLGALTGLGLYYIFNGKWGWASLFILLPVVSQFCHNTGIVLLGDVPWWPVYFIIYALTLLVFVREYVSCSLTENTTVENSMSGSGSLRYVRRV